MTHSIKRFDNSKEQLFDRPTWVGTRSLSYRSRRCEVIPYGAQPALGRLRAFCSRLRALTVRNAREVVSPTTAPSISSQMVVGIAGTIEQDGHGPLEALVTSIVIVLVMEFGGLSLSVAMNVTL